MTLLLTESRIDQIVLWQADAAAFQTGGGRSARARLNPLESATFFFSCFYTQTQYSLGPKISPWTITARPWTSCTHTHTQNEKKKKGRGKKTQLSLNNQKQTALCHCSSCLGEKCCPPKVWTAKWSRCTKWILPPHNLLTGENSEKEAVQTSSTAAQVPAPGTDFFCFVLNRQKSVHDSLTMQTYLS